MIHCFFKKLGAVFLNIHVGPAYGGLVMGVREFKSSFCFFVFLDAMIKKP